VPEGVDVHVRIRADLTLYPNAVVHLERPLLGTMSTLNIASPGDASGGQPVSPGAVLPGAIAPPAILSQAGYGPDQALQLRTMIENASDTVSRMNRVVQSVEASVDEDLGRMRAALDDISAVTTDIRQRVPDWTRRVDSVLAQADEAAARFVPLSERAEAAIDDARQILRNVNEAVDDNRAAVNRIVANVDEAAARLNQESVPMLSSALARVNDGIINFQEAGRMFNSLLLEQAPNLRRILASFRLAADQFRLTSVEVRRNPWRLLYQPGTRELEAELFYDAARTYAQAVSDLREASESLEAVAQAEGVGRVAPTVHLDTVQDVQNRLQDAFRRYEQAERELLQQMIQRRR
jgi:ABC-type transporter Mla subunit MlaD